MQKATKKNRSKAEKNITQKKNKSKKREKQGKANENFLRQSTNSSFQGEDTPERNVWCVLTKLRRCRRQY